MYRIIERAQILGAICSLHSLIMRAGISLGPVAFDGSKLDKQSLTSLIDSVTSEISLLILMG